MTLKDTIAHDLNDAMRARDETRKSTLRMLTAALKNAEIDARGKPFGDAEAVTVVQKQVKQRRDSIEEFTRANRPDLAEKERAELAILETYLPLQASREEIETAARRIAAETGASGPRDIGKVMPVLVREFAGKADGRMVNEVVRAILGA